MTPTMVVILSCAAIVGYDALASYASLTFGFPYVRAAVGSVLLYAAAGYFSAREGDALSVLPAGVAVGLVDATLGWAVSWVIGPGRPPSGSITVKQGLAAAFFSVVLASVCAEAGGFVAQSVRFE